MYTKKRKNNYIIRTFIYSIDIDNDIDIDIDICMYS